MTHAHFLFAGLLTAFISLPAFAQVLPTAVPEDVGVSSKGVEELSTFMRSLISKRKVAGGVTMMARQGRVIHLEPVGLADRETKQPMRKDTIFRIASMTKPITSVAIMMLCDEGKLDLDEPISSYLPEFKNPKVVVNAKPFKTERAKREITIKDLLTHTSGLTGVRNSSVGTFYKQAELANGMLSSNLTLKENAKRISQLPLAFHPGQRWEYGSSTAVLSRLVEVRSGLTLEQFFQQRIFKPLGMVDTHFFVPKGKLKRLATAYELTADGPKAIRAGEVRDLMGFRYSSDYCYRKPHRFFSGGAGLCSTASDYMRFSQMLLNGGELFGKRLLRSETVELMTKNHIGELRESFTQSKFGLGFRVFETDGKLSSGYDWDGFWSTNFFVCPDDEWIVISMTQLSPHPEFLDWFREFERIAARAIQREE